MSGGHWPVPWRKGGETKEQGRTRAREARHWLLLGTCMWPRAKPTPLLLLFTWWPQMGSGSLGEAFHGGVGRWGGSGYIQHSIQTWPRPVQVTRAFLSPPSLKPRCNSKLHPVDSPASPAGNRYQNEPTSLAKPLGSLEGADVQPDYFLRVLCLRACSR